MIIFLKNEQATLDLGKQLSKILKAPCVIYLSGPLGAGKTTLVRGFLQGLGLSESVKSPSYTLIEPYTVNGQTIYHIDLYRIRDSKELLNLGLEDTFAESICFIEWPERGEGFLKAADLKLTLSMGKTGRQLMWQTGDSILSKKLGGL